ncbi:hypothetical protein [Bradyrhizobium sp. RT6a]|uniref:hypothetical protein n=1 Tax=unclassified Bradyrhizobium TaxID=2631580 RepID=UPI003392401F
MRVFFFVVLLAYAIGVAPSFSQDSIAATLDMPDEPTMPQVLAACDEARLLENMRWFNRDAPNSRHTAAVRGIFVRLVNAAEVDSLREAYKEGQRHNAEASRLIDDCDDQTVINLAYTMAEEVRIQQCGGSPPARSASCADVYENIRWSLFEAGICSNLTRVYLRRAMGSDLLLHKAADVIRKGVKISEGHRREVYDSVDYIGDALLVRIAAKVMKDHSIDGLSTSYAINDVTRRQCPGLALLENNE